MAEQIIIDSLDFARKSREIHGIVAHLDFPRLCEVLQSADGSLEYWLEGNRNDRGEAELLMRICGEMKLVCQRCLEIMNFSLDASTRFVVLDESAMPSPEDESDEVEYLAADAKMDVLALIEDEVLLALPYAPVHKDAHCHPTESVGVTKKESPFKVLQGFKINKQ